MHKIVINAINKISGKVVSTEPDAVIVLKNFLKDKGCADLAIFSDIQSLIEVCVSFTEDAGKGILTPELLRAFRGEGESRRIGQNFNPKEKKIDRPILKRIFDAIVGLYPDLHYVFIKRGISLLNGNYVIFTYENVRKVDGLLDTSISGTMYFNNIRTKPELLKLLPGWYTESKSIGEEPKRAKGKSYIQYITDVELLELVATSRLLKLDRNEFNRVGRKA